MFIQQHKSAVMMSSAAVLLMALGNSAFASHGTCQNPNSDSDGDGWGYENSQGQTYGGGDNTGFHSCQMPTTTPPPTPDSCDANSHDYCSENAEGSGAWGYERQADSSCIFENGSADQCAGEDPTPPTPDPSDCIDADGDGWGWRDPPGESCQVDGQPPTPTGTSISTGNQEWHSTKQVDDLVLTNNVHQIRGEDDIVDLQWLGTYNGDSPCSDNSALESIKLRYNISNSESDLGTRNGYVRAFPAVALGTLGGRYQSHGYECGVRNYIHNGTNRRDTGAMAGLLDMADVQSATHFPVKAGELPTTRIRVKADIHSGSAVNGLANVFLDTYWHDVSNRAWVPEAPNGLASLVNTINGINENWTEVWNLNIWFDRPNTTTTGSSSSRSDNGWAGGDKISQITRGGGTFDVYFKKETSTDDQCKLGTAGNCFLYIGLVATDSTRSALRNGQSGVTINYNDLSNWFMSQEFKNLITGGASFAEDTPRRIAYDSWIGIDGSGNDSESDVEDRGPRFPDTNHVIGGLHLGSEIWYNASGSRAEITFEKLGFQVGGDTFGLY